MTNPTPPRRPPLRSAPEIGNEIDLRAGLMALWRGKWAIAVCILFAGTMGLLSVSQQVPVYRAFAKVMFDPPRGSFEGLDTVVAQPNGGGSLTNQIEILRSTSLVKRVIATLDLDQNEHFRGAPARPRSLPPQIAEWAMNLGLRPPPKPPVVASGSAREDALVVAVLQGMTLEPIKGSDVIVIRFTSPAPNLSADVANALAEQYIVDQLEGKLESFRAATQWLTDRVEELQARVETAETAILQAQSRAASEAGASLASAKQQLASVTSALATAQRKTSAIRAAYGRLEGALAAGADLASLPDFRDSRVLATLQERQATLLAEDRALAGTLRPNHPNRVSITDELTQVRAEMEDEADRVLEALRLDLEAALALEEQLTADLRKVEAQNLSLSQQSVEIRNLEREAQASRILYENLLARLQETNAQEDLQGADARILTAAKPPARPVATARNRILAGTLILGALIGAALVLLREALSTTFRSVLQVEEALDLPVLATIPGIRRPGARRKVVQYIRKNPGSALAEAIRNLRTSILFSDLDAPPKVVLFSSAVPGEGKSTTALLTALTSQQMGRTAIIVDCDLRKPALADLIKSQADRPGLLAVLDGTASVPEAVHPEPETGLHILMTQAAERRAQINAADVLASDGFRALIADLSARYDLVVLDTPPTLVVTDARIVASLADAVIFALRWDKTPRGAVQEGLHELALVKAPVIGVALTMVNERRAARFSYGGPGFYKGLYRGYYDA